METKKYGIVKSLNKFKAVLTDKTESDEFLNVIEFCTDTPDQWCDASFSAKIFTDGKLQDIQINGYTFPSIFQGTFHYRGSYSQIFFKMSYISPLGKERDFHYTKNDEDSMQICAELFMNQIYLLSNCQNDEEYDALKSILFDEYDTKRFSAICKNINNIDLAKNIIHELEDKEESDKTFIAYCKQMLEKRFHEITEIISDVNIDDI
jgi:hypothetical protein